MYFRTPPFPHLRAPHRCQRRANYQLDVVLGKEGSKVKEGEGLEWMENEGKEVPVSKAFDDLSRSLTSRGGGACLLLFFDVAEIGGDVSERLHRRSFCFLVRTRIFRFRVCGSKDIVVPLKFVRLDSRQQLVQTRP